MTEATLADMGQNLKKVTEIASALSMWVENFTYEYGAAVYRGHFRKEFEDVQEFVFGIQEQLGECNPDF